MRSEKVYKIITLFYEWIKEGENYMAGTGGVSGSNSYEWTPAANGKTTVFTPATADTMQTHLGTLSTAIGKQIGALQTAFTNVNDTHSKNQAQNMKVLYEALAGPYMDKYTPDVKVAQGWITKAVQICGGKPSWQQVLYYSATSAQINKFSAALNKAAGFTVSPTGSNSKYTLFNILRVTGPGPPPYGSNALFNNQTMFTTYSTMGNFPGCHALMLAGKSCENNMTDFFNNPTVKTILAMLPKTGNPEGAGANYTYPKGQPIPDPPFGIGFTASQQVTLSEGQNLTTYHADFEKYTSEIEADFTKIHGKLANPNNYTQAENAQVNTNLNAAQAEINNFPSGDDTNATVAQSLVHLRKITMALNNAAESGNF
jgi:hypothetical protein